jgi:hypothetical protein
MLTFASWLYHSMLDKVPAVRCLPACPLTGANMKLVVNAIMGSMMAAFAEGMSLADKASRSPPKH